MEKVKIVKIGGNIVDNPQALELFLDNFHKLEGPKVLIHGGGKIASQLSKELGIEVKMHNGRRITDYETLKLVTMVYAGLINKQIVAALQQRGCKAVGLSGADGNAVPATKRAANPIDWGFVGDVNPENINADFLQLLLEGGYVPVFCAITHDSNGSLLNTNADTMASSLARALSGRFQTSLVYCFEKDGVLANPDDDSSVIPLITRESYKDLLEKGMIVGGMIPKLENSFSAIDAGVSQVVITLASAIHQEGGTIIKKS